MDLVVEAVNDIRNCLMQLIVRWDECMLFSYKEQEHGDGIA